MTLGALMCHYGYMYRTPSRDGRYKLDLSYCLLDQWKIGKNWWRLIWADFSPPTLTSERRGEIIVFKQGRDKSLYNAWERYKRLLKRCPMHGIDMTTQMDIFYHSMNYASKGIIDAPCCRAFKRRSAEEAR